MNDTKPGAAETVLYEGRLAWWPMLLRLTLASSALLAAAGVFAFWGAQGKFGALALFLLALYWAWTPTIQRLSFGVQISSNRITVNTGLISRHSLCLNLNRIESIDVDQTPVQRLLGYGAVELKGLGTETIRMHGLADPVEFKRQAFTALDNLAPVEGLR